MINHTARRRAVRVLALVPAVLVTVMAASASADTPEQWENSPAVSPLHAILLLGVVPLGLFLLIALLVYLPSMSRGESYHPGQVWRGEPEWFGGPTTGSTAIDGAGQGAPAAAPESGATSLRGGASGRW